MSDKLIYHLSNVLEELRQILSKEILDSFQTTLSQNKTHLNDNEQYLTTDELATKLGISKSHVNKLRKKYKDFPVLSIQGSVRFKFSEVENFFIQIKNKAQ